MKKTLNSQLKRYYRKVTRIIPKKYPHRKEILSSIQQDISSYLEEHPDISYEDILKHFGTPEEMASSFVESLTPNEVISTAHKTQKWHTIIIIIVIIALLILGGILYHIQWLAKHVAVEIEERTVIYPEVEVTDPQLLEEYSKLLDDAAQTNN